MQEPVISTEHLIRKKSSFSQDSEDEQTEEEEQHKETLIPCPCAVQEEMAGEISSELFSFPSPALTPSFFPGLPPTIHFPLPNEPCEISVLCQVLVKIETCAATCD